MMEHYTATKRNELLVYTAYTWITWVELAQIHLHADFFLINMQCSKYYKMRLAEPKNAELKIQRADCNAYRFSMVQTVSCIVQKLAILKNMNDLQKHYVKWTKSDTQKGIYGFTYKKCPEEENLYR